VSGSPPHPSAGPTVADAGESALVARIRARAGEPPSFIHIGIGDDAAVIEPPRGGLDVVTTDALVEDVHFRRAWTNPESIGWKAVVVNLSDLAAMGASPRAVFLTLALPDALPLADFDAIVEGVVRAASSAGAALAGGNIARSPGPLVVDVTAMGSARRRRVLTRSGARAGDLLYVTGDVGGAAAGLAVRSRGIDPDSWTEPMRACVARYERPDARLRCGRLVAAARAASACIDLSDGLADAVRQLAAASGTGAQLDASLVPMQPGAAEWLGADPLARAIAGGEDYELLFSVPPRRRRAFHAAVARCRALTATHVGSVVAGSGAWLVRDGQRSELAPGFSHFSA
jgi:thiamine-monophosphate kinase